MRRSLPPGPAAVLETLRFDNRDANGLAQLDERGWREALGYCDRNQLTLAWAAGIEGQPCPSAIRERLARDAAANCVRVEKQIALYRELAARFERDGVEHVVLKGFAQWPWFTSNPRRRTQYDLDLYCPPRSLLPARDAVMAMGYEPLRRRGGFPTDHLPSMIRKTGWQWRGDFFDTEIPTSIDLHFRFWDPETERFGPRDPGEFWERRETRCWEGVRFPSLSPPDSLGFACLHALRHLLRGGARPGSVYEIAWFLHRQHTADFWRGWRTLHDDELRRIEAICFLLAEQWFGCRMPEAAEEEIARLPAAVTVWFERWGHAPLEAPFHPNKDELWLHLSLLESRRDRFAILRRRLIPLTAPGPVDAVHVPDRAMNWKLRVRRKWRYALYAAGRFSHHARVLLPAVSGAFFWWTSERELPLPFWRFFAAGLVYNFALFVFFLLYNLHLVRIGFREDFIGAVTGAMTAGTMAGSLAVGWLASQLGLRRCLMLGIAATAVVSAMRVAVTDKVSLLAAGCLAGVFASFWAVCLSPAVAGLTTERSRPVAFSLLFSSGIGLGAIAGVVGGRLPSMATSLEAALYAACAVLPLAMAPLARLELGGRLERKERAYRWSPFLAKFLLALTLWGLATGAFNPFFNVFFTQSLRFSIERMGLIFSASQLAQVMAVLLAPLVFRRFGLVAGIALTQAATGLALAGLGSAAPAVAGWLYALYASFQYMSEPGTYSLLMARVREEERNGASALNFVVLFGSQAIAAALAGAAITKVGYAPVLFTAAAMALLAALAFRCLPREPSRQ
ncbi:MAG: nucleotidyltransferase family protein [Bryobacterales bacterium]|nr:nucleotidyltransferase family protein [Bryobacterales bacterium]